MKLRTTLIFSLLLAAALAPASAQVAGSGSCTWNADGTSLTETCGATPAPSPTPSATPSPAPTSTPAPTSFESAVSNFCTAHSLTGCHYWPMNETSGTAMLDALGSLNGTYTDDVSDGAFFDPGEPMGIADGSVGVDIWNARAYVEGLPTTPAQT